MWAPSAYYCSHQSDSLVFDTNQVDRGDLLIAVPEVPAAWISIGLISIEFIKKYLYRANI